MKLEMYSKEELENIVKFSNSYKEILTKLDISLSGSSYKSLKKRLEKEKIDTSHVLGKKTVIKRTFDNIFIENSTASQHVLRDWYKAGEYTPQKCSICELEPQWQGKELTLILDHINGINNDDRLENLRWVCPNCNQQLETTGYKKIRVKKKEIKHYYCIDCGTEINRQSQRCMECFKKFNKQQKIDNYPMSREELKIMIRTLPFTKIGEKYHCTDNGIRKYCDGYNLPRTKKEINKFSDEEWALI